MCRKTMRWVPFFPQETFFFRMTFGKEQKVEKTLRLKKKLSCKCICDVLTFLRMFFSTISK